MANSRVISACVVLAVVASGCGGSKTTTTSTVASAPSINTATNAPTGTATGTPTQGTSPTTTQKPGPPPPRTQTKAAPKFSKAIERKVKAAEQRNKAFFKAKAKALPPTPTHLPRSRRFPDEVQERFLAACQVGQGSPSLCKCVLAKQELRPIENRESRTERRGRSIAETLILGETLVGGVTVDQAIRHGSSQIKPGNVPLPRGVRSSLAACRGA